MGRLGPSTLTCRPAKLLLSQADKDAGTSTDVQRETIGARGEAEELLLSTGAARDSNCDVAAGRKFFAGEADPGVVHCHIGRDTRPPPPRRLMGAAHLRRIVSCPRDQTPTSAYRLAQGRPPSPRRLMGGVRIRRLSGIRGKLARHAAILGISRSGAIRRAGPRARRRPGGRAPATSSRGRRSSPGRGGKPTASGTGRGR